MADDIAAQKIKDLFMTFRHTRDDYNIKIAEHHALIRKHKQEIDSLKRQKKQIIGLWDDVLSIVRQLGY